MSGPQNENSQREAADLSSWMQLPHRLAVDGKGYVWRYFDEGMVSMAPVNPDNRTIPEPVKYYVPDDIPGLLSMSEVRQIINGNREGIAIAIAQDYKVKLDAAKSENAALIAELGAVRLQVEAARRACENAPDPVGYSAQYRRGYARATSAIDGILSGATAITDTSTACDVAREGQKKP